MSQITISEGPKTNRVSVTLAVHEASPSSLTLRYTRGEMMELPLSEWPILCQCVAFALKKAGVSMVLEKKPTKARKVKDDSDAAKEDSA